tara:strand:+ start:1058 stop:1930 length:873 start_codon:yes stop_codon:yes gene_type:complete
MKPLIRRILREQTDPALGDKVWAAVKGVGKFALKNNSLSWLIKTLVGATPTKARLIFPKEGWETAAVEILEQIGIVTGTYKTLSEANEFFKDLKENDIILEELLIGSHGSPGTLLVTSEGRFYHEKKWVSLDNGEVNAMGEPEGEMVLTGKKIPISKSYGFRTEFLKHIKPVVNSNTKVYFTACHGAEKLTMLKEAADYLGCECYACMGTNVFSFGCEDSNWSCIATNVPSFEYSGQRSSKEKVVVHGDEKLRGYKSAQAYTDSVNDFYVENGVCQEQPNVPFNWITLFG